MPKYSYFWRNYFGSAIFFMLLLIIIIFLTRPEWFQRNDTRLKAKLDIEQALVPSGILPSPSFNGEWVIKPNYLLFYDQSVMQSRFTVHKLSKTQVTGNASRYQIRYNQDELIGSGTAAYRDYSRSGFDRGHLVPAADFQCCQELMNETFAMSNIAPFDTTLNRHAWAELEQKIRFWARKKGELYVISGPVFVNKNYSIGRYNEVVVPTHFFKVICTFDKGQVNESISYLLPNLALDKMDFKNFRVSIDQLENRTNLDFFKGISDEDVIESKTQVGSWPY